MIALLKSGEYYAGWSENINDFLMEYADYFGMDDIKVFKVMIDSNEFTTEELVEYVNKKCFDWESEIQEIYKLDAKVY